MMENTLQRKQPNPRINMALYGENLEFLRHAAWKNHMSITAYVNHLVDKDKDNYARNEWKHPEIQEATE